MGVAASTIKYIVLLCNLLLTVLGILTVAVGIFIVASSAPHEVDHGESIAGGCIIAMGVVVLWVAGLGCCGTLRQSRPIIVMYVVALMLVLLLQLIMMSMASQGSNDGLAASVRNGFATLWADEPQTAGTLAFYEDWLDCCGVNGTQDYRDIGRPVPSTCCRDHDCRPEANRRHAGCRAQFEAYLAHKLRAFTVLAWILVVVEAVTAAIGCLLLNTWKNQRRRGN